MQQAIILDWDGVIFNDALFKQDLFTSMTAHGLTQEEIAQLYKDTKDANGYNDINLAHGIADATDATFDEVLAVINKLISETATKYIYTDARSFIEKLREQSHDMIILTAGDHRIQHDKIAASGLKDFFKEIIVVEVADTRSNKQQALSNVAKSYNNILFYDDKLATIIHLHETLRNETSIVPIWVDRTARNKVYDGFTVDTLSYDTVLQYSDVYAKKRTLIAAAYIQQDDKVLMVQEEKGRAKGLWTIPIGHVEHDQTFLEAAIREVQEETSYHVDAQDIRRLLTVKGTEYLGGDQDLDHIIVIVCFDAAIDHQADSDITAAELDHRWVPIHEMSQLPLRGEWQLLFP